ncbi:MAG: hypothetical protein FJ029_07295 [Actinobacteria bacterium]|nr:hypothetical protein [Actinomycetota bacterium]
MNDLDATELLIHDTPQFFFDNALIEEVQNLTRTLHRPVNMDGNPLIRSDRPWEHVTYFTSVDWSLWRDVQTGRFHCTYTDFKLDREKLARAGGTLIDWDISRLRQCYAYSDDGLRWVKPALGLVHEHGHDTNIMLGSETYGNVWGLSVFQDPLASDPSRRYLGLHVMAPPGFRVAADVPGAHVRLGHSPDGVHWTVADERPRFGRAGTRVGDSMVPDFDPATGTYLLFTRHPWMGLAPRVRAPNRLAEGGSPEFDAVVDAPNRRSRRRIFLSESRDYLNWSEPRLILAPDSMVDNLDDAFYGMKPMRVGGQWLGFLQVFHMVSNTLDVQLVHSRDGRTWKRLFPGQAWLPCGPAGSWDQYYASLPRIPDVAGDEYWVYHGGGKSHHDWWIVGQREGLDVPEAWDWGKVGLAMGLAKLRKGGFVSIDAHRLREGMLATQPFVAAGDRLVINAACGPGGYVKVEVADVRDRVLPGLSRDDCDAFTGDAVAHTVTWRGDLRLAQPSTADAGTVYTQRLEYRRLRFILRDAQLYSFQIVAARADARAGP